MQLVKWHSGLSALLWAEKYMVRISHNKTLHILYFVKKTNTSKYVIQTGDHRPVRRFVISVTFWSNENNGTQQTSVSLPQSVIGNQN